MSAMISSPTFEAPGNRRSPFFAAIILIVRSALSVSSATWPLSLSSPDGESTATTKIGESLSSMPFFTFPRTRFAWPLRGNLNPVPRTASISMSEVAIRFLRTRDR